MDGNRWERAEELLVTCAEGDLQDTGEVGPALVAFRGEQLLFVAWLRPFEKGHYHEPMIELLALAMPLDADRLAVSFAGRAWSLEDPIVPVTPEADLRQRVHMVHLCDGWRGKPRTVSVMRPFEVDGGSVRWGEPQRSEGGVEGWVPECLAVAIETRGTLREPLPDIVAQAARVSMLGHDLYVSPELSERLGTVEPAPWLWQAGAT